MSTAPIYCYFGHPKCGGTWMSGFLLGIFNELGFKSIQTQLTLLDDPAGFLQKNDINVLLSQNSSYEKVQQLGTYKAFHLIRDPRDIAVSAYFSYRNTHSTEGWQALADLREVLKSKDFNEGFFTLLEWNDEFIQHIADWHYDDPNILEFKMEELKQNPVKSMSRIMDFFGLLKSQKQIGYQTKGLLNRVLHHYGLPFLFSQRGLSESDIKRIHDKVSFKKLSKGREIGQADTQSHYRSGETGDWKNHFTSEHKAWFKKKYGELLIKLGYESDMNW